MRPTPTGNPSVPNIGKATVVNGTVPSIGGRRSGPRGEREEFRMLQANGKAEFIMLDLPANDGPNFLQSDGYHDSNVGREPR